MAKSKTTRHKMTHPTVGWDHGAGKLETTAKATPYALPYAEANPGGKQYGMRITVDAFHQLLKGALQTQAGQKQPSVRFVEFSKASIFRVLSQPGCEYIRFYFVYPEKAKMSLVLEGLDAAGQALKLASHVMKMADGGAVRVAQEEDPDYEEVGNGVDAFAGSPKPAVSETAERDALVTLLEAINTIER